jgi:hypothetical protein
MARLQREDDFSRSINAKFVSGMELQSYLSGFVPISRFVLKPKERLTILVAVEQLYPSARSVWPHLRSSIAEE